MNFIKSIFTKLITGIDNFDEGFLTVVVMAITAGLTFLAYKYGDANLQEMSNRGLKLSTFMMYTVSLMKYLGAKKLDVMKEILEENNIALAIILASMIAGGAACILL
jgi:ABC-type transport system involved in cytochrome bd biosynthesis fused ATPase/permease subunit